MKFLRRIDGDTVVYLIDGEEVTIRSAGLDTFETQSNANPSPLGKASTEYVDHIAGDVRVSAERDVYGRTLGTQLDANGQDVAPQVIRQGLALPTSAAGDAAYLSYLRDGPQQETDPELQRIVNTSEALRASGELDYAIAGMPEYRSNDRRGTGERAFERGTEGLKSNLNAFLQAVNNVAGDDAESEEYRQKALYHAEQAGLIKKDVQSFRDVDSLSKAATYAYELLAEEAPSLAVDAALTLTGAGAGAVIARRAAATTLRKTLGQEGFEKLAQANPQLIADGLNAAAGVGAKRAAGAAYVAGTYPQEAGAVQLELNENGLEDEGATALGMGAVSTLVQAAPELALAGKLLKQADVDASDLAGIVGTAKTLAKNVGTTAAAEGGAEGAATALQKSAVALHKDDYEVFSEQNIREMQEAIVAGGVMGGTLATAGTAAGAGYRKADQIYREKRETQAAERQAALEAEQQAQATQQAQQAELARTGAPAEQFTPQDAPKSNYGQLYSREQLMPLGDVAQEPAQNEIPATPLPEAPAPVAEAPAEPAPVETAVEATSESSPELRDEVDVPGTEVDTVEQLRGHPAFVAANTAIANRFNEETDFREGLIPSSILLPAERAELEKVGALTAFELSDGSIMEAIDPQMVQDVMDYGFEATPTPGIMYSGPAPSAKVVDDSPAPGKVSYGTGTSMVDGVYEKGNGMFAFAEMADMLADPAVMGDKADSSYQQQMQSVDPMSDDFDATVESMANRLRLYGKGDKDKINTLLDNARLGEANQAAAVPVLRQIRERLPTFKLTNPQDRADSDRMSDDDRRLAHIQVELQRLTKSMARHGVTMGKTILGTLADIETALGNGVELTAKQMSAIDSIARAARVSASPLWTKAGKNINRRYKKVSDKVRSARKAATKDKDQSTGLKGGNEREAKGSTKGDFTPTQRTHLKTFFDGVLAGNTDELKDFAKVFAQIWRKPDVDVEVQGVATDSTPESGLSIVDGTGDNQTDINGLASHANNPEHIAISMDTVRERIEAVKNDVPMSVIEMLNDWLIARGDKPSTVAKMSRKTKLGKAAAHFAQDFEQFVQSPQRAEYNRLQLGAAAAQASTITREVTHMISSALGLSQSNERHIARILQVEEKVFAEVKNRVVASLQAAGIDATELADVGSYSMLDAFAGGLRAAASGTDREGQLNKQGQSLASDFNDNALWNVRAGTRAAYDLKMAAIPAEVSRELSQQSRQQDVSAILDTLTALNAVPLGGNELEQTIRSVAEYNGSGLSSRLSRYVFKKGRTDPIGRKALSNTPVAEFISVSFVDSEGNAQQARIHVAGYIREKVDVIKPTGSMVDEAGRKWDEGTQDTDETLKNVDRIEAIQDAYSQLISDLVGFDDRVYGLKLDISSLTKELTDEATVLYRSPDGETITLKQLNDVLATRQYQASLRENYWSTHEASELKNQKTQAALALEKVLVTMYRMLQDPDARSVLIQRVASSQGKKHFAEAKKTIEQDLERQFSAMFTLVYGDKNRHLDNPDHRDATTQTELFDEPYHASALEFAGMEAMAKAGGMSAQRLKASRVNGDKVYGSSTSQVSMDFMKTVVSSLDGVMDRSELEPTYRRLTEARTALSKSFDDRDDASVRDDITRVNGVDSAGKEPTATEGRDKAQIRYSAGGDAKGYEPAPTARGDLNETLRLSVNRLAEAAGLAGVKVRFNFGDESSIRYSAEDDTLDITMYGHFDLKTKEGQASFLTHVAHELAHAVTSFENLNEQESATVLADYAKAVPNPADYDIDEWLADQVATQILTRFANSEAKTLHSKAPTMRRYVARMVRRLTQLADGLSGALKALFPTRTGLYQVSDTMKELANALISKRRAEGFDPSVLPMEMFFNGRDITGKMARAKSKARELASGGTDSAFVKFFKPAAMRLENIDRALARMFFNPPGAKQEQGMGLMDASVATRTKLVNHFSRLFPKVDDYRKDYQEYLKTGKSSTALTGIFRYAAELYSEVNPGFKFEGVPVLLEHDEIARRGNEFRSLVSSGLKGDELKMVDELLKEFDSHGVDALDNANLRPSNPFARQELLDKLIRSRPQAREKLAAAGFMASPTVAGLNQFFGGVAMRVEFERLFSAFEPAKDNGTPLRVPNSKLRSRLEAIEDPAKRREAIRVIGSMLGFDGLRIHPAWRATQDWTISVVTAAILPLSGFASLPDPIMPFIRTRSFKEALRGMFTVAKAYMTDYKRTQEMLRTLSLATNSIHDTAWSHLVSNRGESSIPDKITDVLFRFNGLKFLTTVSRNVSAVLAIDMLKRHASMDTRYSRDLMQQMGVTRQDGLALVNYIDQHGTTPAYTPGGDPEHNRLHDIAQRVVTTFTNSSLVHPSRAQLPLVMNDPNFRVLTLLKPFMYGFHSVIYGGNYRAARDKMATARTLGDFILSSPMGAMPFILAFGLMMPLAALGLAGREWFKDLFVNGTPAADKLDGLNEMEYLSKIFSRAGGYGALEYPMQIWEATGSEYRNPFITAAGPVIGTLNTTAEDVWGAFNKETQKTIQFGMFEIPVD